MQSYELHDLVICADDDDVDVWMTIYDFIQNRPIKNSSFSPKNQTLNEVLWSSAV